MRIIIPAIQTPFLRGGADRHVKGLQEALRKVGHEVEIVTFPFKFGPESYLEGLCRYCLKQDFSQFDGFQVDLLIALQFPAYYVQHPNKVIWLMHQHRAYYDLYDDAGPSGPAASFRDKAMELDNIELAKARRLFTNSKNVSARLQKYNRITAPHLYHPPADPEKYYCASPYNYIFYPSRLESLKRQDLLIEAMRHVSSPIKAIIAGDGGQHDRYASLIDKHKLNNKVGLVGQVSEDEKMALYASSIGVFFGPYDEDYGYITLEAMLSGKPVITCTDSGGPLEFIEDGKNGFVVEPSPEAVAAKIDWLWNNQATAAIMGKTGRQNYLGQNISWQNVVEKLLGDSQRDA